MSKSIRTLLLVAVMVLAAATAVSAQTRVGVIDLAVVIDESKAGKEASAALNAFIAERQAAVDEIAARWEELAARMEDEEESFTDDERESLQAEMDALAEEYAAAVEQFEAEIDAAVEALRGQILNEIGAVLQLVAETGGFDIIVDASQAYYYRRVVDLTFEVIREYDTLWEEAQRQAVQQDDAGQ